MTPGQGSYLVEGGFSVVAVLVATVLVVTVSGVDVDDNVMMSIALLFRLSEDDSIDELFSSLRTTCLPASIPHLKTTQ